MASVEKAMTSTGASSAPRHSTRSVLSVCSSARRGSMARRMARYSSSRRCVLRSWCSPRYQRDALSELSVSEDSWAREEEAMRTWPPWAGGGGAGEGG